MRFDGVCKLQRDKKNILNMGCGDRYLKGYINLDTNKNIKADVYHDLDLFPYPFPDNYFDEIIAHNVVEHLKGNPAILYVELNRILKPNGILEIRTPHHTGNGNYNSQDHIKQFGCYSWDYICYPSHRKGADFTINKRLFEKVERKLWWCNENHGLISKILSFPANLIPHCIVERTFIYWVGGYDEILIRLKAVK